MGLENELTRYFEIIETSGQDGLSDTSEEYSFAAFSNLLRDDPSHVLVILEEIKKVHDEALEMLSSEAIDDSIFASLVHKVKGGAHLLGAQRFIQSCSHLENHASLPEKIDSFQKLLQKQNQIILRYQAQYSGA